MISEQGREGSGVIGASQGAGPFTFYSKSGGHGGFEGGGSFSVSQSELEEAQKSISWIMQNIPMEFALHDQCPVDMLMHVLGVLAKVKAEGGRS